MALDFYKGWFRRRWGCTDVFDEVPDKIREQMLKDAGIDPSTESVVAAAFVDAFGLRGAWFVVITEDRVIAKKNATIDQSLFKDVRNVEKTPDNVKVRSDHNEFLIFQQLTAPKATLSERLFSVINKQWLAVRKR